jgi:hypothetical protein
MGKVYFSHLGWFASPNDGVATRYEWPLWRDVDPASWEKRDALLDRIEEGFMIQAEAGDQSFTVWVKPHPDGTAEMIVEGRVGRGRHCSLASAGRPRLAHPRHQLATDWGRGNPPRPPLLFGPAGSHAGRRCEPARAP